MPNLPPGFRAGFALPQVFPDGVQYELSPGYHTMVAVLMHQALTQARFRRQKLPRGFEKRVLSMFDYLANLARPDGTYPVMNDAGCALQKGNGRLADVGRKEKRSGWIWSGSAGKEGSPPEVGSVHFADAGYAVQRSGWQPDDRWAFMDMGQLGSAHQHEDKLGFWLFAYGRSFLVDRGRHLYDSSEVSYSPHLRSARAHSIILVDGEGQHSRGRPDRWIASEPVPLQWSVREGEVRAAASYDLGYGEDNGIAEPSGFRTAVWL